MLGCTARVVAVRAVSGAHQQNNIHWVHARTLSLWLCIWDNVTSHNGTNTRAHHHHGWIFCQTFTLFLSEFHICSLTHMPKMLLVKQWSKCKFLYFWLSIHPCSAHFISLLMWRNLFLMWNNMQQKCTTSHLWSSHHACFKLWVFSNISTLNL